MSAAPDSGNVSADERDGASKAAGQDDKTTSTGKDGCNGATTTTTRKDGCAGSTATTSKGDKTTTTTGKGGKCPTTTTTRKGGGKNSTTTTTEKQRATTSTTQGGGDPGGGPDPGSSGPGSSDPGSSDPGGSGDPGTGLDTPVEPQYVPDDPAPEPEPAGDPEDWAGPGSAGDEGPYDLSPGGPVGPPGENVPVGPMAVPGAAPSVLPMFGDLFPGSGGRAPAVRAPAPSRTRSSGRVQQLASSPRVTAQASAPEMAESGRVSRSLAGVRTSASETAFPASIISTPEVFPINHRDPLAAGALVLLMGVSRELFRAWRRRAGDYWPA